MSTAMRILTVVGARPQFIKAAVVSRAVAAWNGSAPRRMVDEVLVHTGQHYDDEMSGSFFRELHLPRPAYDLGVGSGSHGVQTGRMLERLEPVMEQERPDWVLVYGDTNSTLTGALAASKLGVPVAHVEAGLRSYNRAMPEEINRVLTDHLSRILLCPTTRAIKNLSCEGIVRGVHLAGDVMYDSLLYNLERAGSGEDVLAGQGVRPGGYALATIHRAESTDDPAVLRGMFAGLGRLELPVLLPLHPRTRRALEEAGSAPLPGSVRVIPPVPYLAMLVLEKHARLILTDSGGLQKEAFWLKVPCVTLRHETEWVETVEAGWNRLAGTDPDAIESAVRQSLTGQPPEPGNPYGDGQAGGRIVATLAAHATRVEP